MPDLIAALHAGQPHEPVGLMLIDRQERLEGDFDKERGVWPTVTRYAVQRIGRLSNGSRYQEIVDLVADAIGGVEADRLSFLVDITTAGRTALAMLEHHRPIPVVIAGEVGLPKVAERAIRVPQSALVGALTVIIGDRRLSADPKLEHADQLGRQMQEFRTAKRPGEPPLREDHAELAICTMLATWWGEMRLRSLIKQPSPPREPIEPPRWPTFNELLKQAGSRPKRTRI